MNKIQPTGVLHKFESAILWWEALNTSGKMAVVSTYFPMKEEAGITSDDVVVAYTKVLEKVNKSTK